MHLFASIWTGADEIAPSTAAWVLRVWNCVCTLASIQKICCWCHFMINNCRKAWIAHPCSWSRISSTKENAAEWHSRIVFVQLAAYRHNCWLDQGAQSCAGRPCDGFKNTERGRQQIFKAPISDSAASAPQYRALWSTANRCQYFII